MRKCSSDKGIWARLRRIRDGLQLWCGSFYFTQGATKEVHARDVHEFIQSMPATALPVLVGGDANTEFKWGEGHDGGVQSYSLEAKGEYMMGAFRERGILFTSPHRRQWNVATSRPRNTEATGRQIDGVAARHTKDATALILQDSYLFVGSDHEAVLQKVEVRVGKGNKEYEKPKTAPRRVARPTVLPTSLNQASLQDMAQNYTETYPCVRYKDPPEVRVMFTVARRGREPEAWKRALKGRAEAKKAWKTAKIQQATSGDWGAFKALRRKGATGWEASFATAQQEGVDPHQVVHDHLQGIYGDKPISPFPSVEVESVEDFSREELSEALGKGLMKKAVGADQVSHELLVEIGRDEQGSALLLEWFNKLLHAQEELPEDWSTTIMIILPKISKPATPKDLRPICLGSATSKLFSRMLLRRTMPALKYGTPSQVMGEGRQTTDYLRSMSRLMQLEQEWKMGLWAVKLDIAKAFDTLDRDRFLHRLAGHLGHNEVLKCWWKLFSKTEAQLCTAWGTSTVSMRSGIRQGAVESPHLFSAAVDWVLQDLLGSKELLRVKDNYEGLGVSEAAFVDDILAWHGARKCLQGKVAALTHELREWGLRVNLQKCQVYASPYSRDLGSFQVDGEALERDDHLQVMGISFRVGIAPKEALAPLFARVKAKFWSMKDMMRARTPLPGRLRLLHRVLGNAALWCAGAFFPDKGSLQTINILQSQLVVWSMRLSKGRDEDWVTFRIRTFRIARYVIIQQHCPERWSTSWLRRVWGYAGHRARSGGWRSPPLSYYIDCFRDLRWWEQEQQSSTGLRHPARFYPKLMTEERALNRAAQGAWRRVAQDRDAWQQGLRRWLEQQDLEWSSHTQLAIEG